MSRIYLCEHLCECILTVGVVLFYLLDTGHARSNAVNPRQAAVPGHVGNSERTMPWIKENRLTARWVAIDRTKPAEVSTQLRGKMALPAFR